MDWIIGCLLIITIIALYVPIIHIRMTNKVLKVLEQIEANTRK
jgi:hypothetical protein